MHIFNDEQWENNCVKKFRSLYGKTAHSKAEKRFLYELSLIKSLGNVPVYRTAQMLVHQSNKFRIPVVSGGNILASFVAFVTGITNINPLSPHYICPKCFYTEFHPEENCGWDLVSKNCPQCDCKLKKDGYNLHEMTAFGGDGHKVPTMSFGFGSEYAHKVKNTIDKIVSNTGIESRMREIIHLCDNSNMTLLKNLQDTTGVSINDAELCDAKILRFICDDNSDLTQLFENSVFSQLVKRIKPKNYGELIRVAILSDERGKGKDVIFCCEDVIEYLLKKGIDGEIVYKICNRLKRGKQLNVEQKQAMRDSGVPLHYVKSCEQIKFLSSKVRCLPWVYTGLCLVYYKLNYPREFEALTQIRR